MSIDPSTTFQVIGTDNLPHFTSETELRELIQSSKSKAKAEQAFNEIATFDENKYNDLLEMSKKYPSGNKATAELQRQVDVLGKMEGEAREFYMNL